MPTSIRLPAIVTFPLRDDVGIVPYKNAVRSPGSSGPAICRMQSVTNRPRGHPAPLRRLIAASSPKGRAKGRNSPPKQLPASRSMKRHCAAHDGHLSPFTVLQGLPCESPWCPPLRRSPWPAPVPPRRQHCAGQRQRPDRWHRWDAGIPRLSSG